jgi:septal ring factor EnvC (AmiA/AmiB activator)
MNDDDKPSRNISLPAWSLGLLGTVFLAALAWTSSQFFSLRDDSIRQATRIEQVEREVREVKAETKSTPTALATMAVEIGSLKVAIEEMRADIKRLAAQRR